MKQGKIAGLAMAIFLGVFGWGYAGAEEAKPYTFEISPETYWFFYREPTLNVEWSGVMYGLRASFEPHFQESPIMFRTEGRLSVGGVDYDGFLTSGAPHSDSGTDWFAETRGLLGYDLNVKEGTTLTPFLGIGYRYWFDNLQSANAYQRNVAYLYSPLGVESRSRVGENWTWGIRAEYDFFWRGWVDSHLEDVNPLFSTAQNTQDSGFGARGSLYLSRAAGEGMAVSIEPYLRYWNIDVSDTTSITYAGALVGSGYEPGNKTVEAGLQVSVLF